MPTDKSLWESYASKVNLVKKKTIATPSPLRGGNRVEVGSKQIGVNKNRDVFKIELERKREKTIRQGKIEIEAKLDLHGMSQAEAFAALAGFMQKKTKAGKRNLLIVTGVGREGQGVLRQNLKTWLQQLPEAASILAVREAAPNHGGKGAFYVLMRKKRA